MTREIHFLGMIITKLINYNVGKPAIDSRIA